jgi:glutaredoxin
LTFIFFSFLIKLMAKKITVYTISSCPFSEQEKNYLKANNLSFEEKNLETNREFLTEMLAVSNNFAGTPLTKIEKEDGQISVLKGFTKEEFDKELGLTQAKPEPEVTMVNAGVKVPPAAPAPAPPVAPSPVVPPVAPSPVASVASDATPAASEATPSVAKSKTTTPTEQTTTPPTPVSPPASPTPSPDESLKSVLDNLEQKTKAPAVNQPATSQPAANQPSSPPVSSSNSNLPKIPDFPK